MRCTAYCSARSYDLPTLLCSIEKDFFSTSYEGSLHFKHLDRDAFFFSFGTAVFWNCTEDQEHALLSKIKEAEKDPLTNLEFDEFSFEYGEVNKVFQDQIILENPRDTLSKLAISYGLAQSIKLIIFETRIETVIQEVEKITTAMAQQGKVPLSRRAIGKKIGKLFFERNSINLHSDFLNPPDFFWEYPELEPLYDMTAKDLDIRLRTQALNRKLDIMHELYQILGDELNHRHTAKLEWIVIILILIEVILGITELLSNNL
jgi:uncharacterized Rmd1/YagE family protein